MFGAEAVLVTPLLKGLSIGVNDIRRNKKKILKKIDSLENTIRTVDAKIDEKTLQKARAAITQLLEGVSSNVQSVRNSQIQMASDKFNDLVHLDPNQKTSETSGEFDNKYLISFGYLGKFYYFSIEGDQRNAASQVYECTQKWIDWNRPLFGLEIFPIEFFSKDYHKLIIETRNQMLITYTTLKEHKAHNFRENILHFTRKGAELIGTSGLDVAGLLDKYTVAPVFKKFGKELSTPEVLQLLKGQLQQLGNSSDLKDIENVQSLAEQLETQYIHLHDELTQECQKQRNVLQNYSLDELLVFGWRNETLPVIIRLEQLLEETSYKLSPVEKNGLQEKIAQLKTNLDKYNIGQIQIALVDIGGKVRSLSTVAREFEVVSRGWDGFISNLESLNLINR
jgi:hypothetical protein